MNQETELIEKELNLLIEELSQLHIEELDLDDYEEEESSPSAEGDGKVAE